MDKQDRIIELLTEIVNIIRDDFHRRDETWKANHLTPEEYVARHRAMLDDQAARNAAREAERTPPAPVAPEDHDPATTDDE